MAKSARQLSFEILLKMNKDKAYSNLAIDSAVKAYCPDSTDCAFISYLVYGVTERKITLDYVISKYLSKPVNKLKPDVLIILRLGAYQLLFSEKIPRSAAVNESVKLAKNNGCGYASGMVNAVLRKITADDLILPENMVESEKISVTYSAPAELVKFLIYHYGEDNTKAFLQYALEPKKIFVKVNTVKITSDELKTELEKEGVEVKNTFLKNAVEISFSGAVYNLESYKKGYFHVEDLSSQLCVEALDAFPGGTVIDVCAAPGGKTFSIAQATEDNGEIYSCDIYEKRTGLIKDGAARLGLTSVIPTVNDATQFNERFPAADRVLCDVPCSGLGIIGKKPEIKYKKLDDVKELIPIQKNILDISSRYLKKGGRLIYSTCSVNPNENKKVCEWFLSNHPDFKSVKVLPHIPRTIDDGNYLTLMMHTNKCDGFFIAAFERK